MRRLFSKGPRTSRPPILEAADQRLSVISSAVDLYPPPTGELIDLLIEAGGRAKTTTLAELEARSDEVARAWVRQWPGEHYRLLAALAELIGPSTIVEVGTFKGHGSLALSAGCPSATVVTYDLVPWDSFPDTALATEDFTSGRIEQRLGDLADPGFLETQLHTLKGADLLFIDGPKDGHWEQRFFDVVLPHLSDRRRLIIIDDIRLLEMVQLWRSLPRPKLDVTSFGHWSGTGLVHTM